MVPPPAFEAPAYQGAAKLAGRVVLITGGDSGIGRAAAVLCAREGADIAIGYLADEQTDAEQTAAAVAREGHRCALVPGDLTERAACDRLVEDTVARFGRLDVVVNNAAFQRHVADVREIDDEQWDRTFRTNIYAYFDQQPIVLRGVRRIDH